MKATSLLRLLLALLCLSVASAAQESPIRALAAVYSNSQPRSTVLPTNTGWQPIYTVEMTARAGDLLRVIGQTQLTVEANPPAVGQQLRLTVNGVPAGPQTIEINSYTSSHHLPMQAFGLVPVTADGPVTVTLEGSSFHSDGEFPVNVDNQNNLAYGSLIVEQYRAYPTLGAAWEQGALLLTEIHQPLPLTQEVWGMQPYIQETLASVNFAANAGDVLRPSGRAVANGTLGHEQFTGVLTSGERAISPYGGENVDPENPYVPMLIEGYDKVAQDGNEFLEYRIYGAFGHGLTLLPETPRFEVAHFGSYGRELRSFGQDPSTVDSFASNGDPVEVLSQEVDLEDGDLLRLTANLQFAQPNTSQPVTVATGMHLQVDGPTGITSSYTAKRLTPVKSVLPLTDFMTVRAAGAGRYRISLKASGLCDQGAVPLRLDTANSQLQYLLYGMPR